MAGLPESSNNGGNIPTSIHPHPHHHHHFFYISPHCPLHRSILQPKHHSPSCFFSASQNREPVSSIPPADSHFSFPDVQRNRTSDADMMMQQGQDDVEEEGDPVFVLTDEWRDFFAKSEARRRLAKKQAKKGKK